MNEDEQMAEEQMVDDTDNEDGDGSEDDSEDVLDEEDISADTDSEDSEVNEDGPIGMESDSGSSRQRPTFSLPSFPAFSRPPPSGDGSPTVSEVIYGPEETDEDREANKQDLLETAVGNSNDDDYLFSQEDDLIDIHKDDKAELDEMIDGKEEDDEYLFGVEDPLIDVSIGGNGNGGRARTKKVRYTATGRGQKRNNRASGFELDSQAGTFNRL